MLRQHPVSRRICDGLTFWMTAPATKKNPPLDNIMNYNDTIPNLIHTFIGNFQISPFRGMASIETEYRMIFLIDRRGKLIKSAWSCWNNAKIWSNQSLKRFPLKNWQSVMVMHVFISTLRIRTKRFFRKIYITTSYFIININLACENVRQNESTLNGYQLARDWPQYSM